MPLRRARKTNLIPARNHCPGISGIAVPYLLKSLSANYRNPCPGICETRTLSKEGDPLEILQQTVDFEFFRAWLVEGLDGTVPDGKRGLTAALRN